MEKEEMDSSPLRSLPNRKPIHTSEIPSEFLPEKSSSTAIIALDRRPYGFSPLRSPIPEKKPISPPVPPPENMPVNNPLPPVIVMNRSIREELSMVAKMDAGENGFSGGRGGRVEDVGDRRTRTLSSILGRQRREAMVKKAALGFRVCEVVFCLVSFSVMAADKTRGWAGDSFDRYKEFRYCISVTVIGFAYSGFQAYNLAYHLITGKHIILHHLRHYFDFSMDQILTYLLLSASSSAVTRVDIWQINWGKDEFTEMASASVGVSFLAFTAFALSSLISGYSLCTRNFT